MEKMSRCSEKKILKLLIKQQIVINLNNFYQTY
jgi:hypothetical protein